MEKFEKLLLTKIAIIPFIIFFQTIYQKITNNFVNTQFFLTSLILLLIIETIYIFFRKEIKWKTKNYPKKITQLVDASTNFQKIFIFFSLINFSLNENFFHILNPLLLVLSIMPFFLVFKNEFNNLNKLYK